MWIEKKNPIIDCMESNLVLGPDYGIPGLFSAKNSKFFLKPADALANPRIKKTTLRWAKRVGKGLLIEGYVLYVLKHVGGNILYYSTTNKVAEDFGEQRILKNLRELDCLKDLWPKTAKAQRSNTPVLPHMAIEFLGENESNTNGKMGRHVIWDEAHLADKGLIYMGFDRCEDHWDGKILVTSTAGDQDSDEEKNWLSSSMEEWHLGCPDCSKLIRLTRSNPHTLQWDTDDYTCPNGERDLKRTMETVKFHCPHCGASFRDDRTIRLEMDAKGDYIQTNLNPEADHRGFWVPQEAGFNVSWEKIAGEFIKAEALSKKGQNEALRNYIIKSRCETWMKFRQEEELIIAKGGYRLYDDENKELEFDWPEEYERFMFVDVQGAGGRHFYLVIRAFAKTGDSRLIFAARIIQWSQIRDFQVKYKVPDNQVGVDCKYRTKEVQEQCALNGWWALRAVESKNNRYSTWNHKMGDYSAKRPFSQEPPFVLFSRTIGREVYCYSRSFCKKWFRETTHNHIMGNGDRWEVPMDADKLRFQGTKNQQSSYMAQIDSWCEVSIENPKTLIDTPGWRKTGDDDHCRACEEGIFVLALMCEIVSCEIIESD